LAASQEGLSPMKLVGSFSYGRNPVAAHNTGLKSWSLHCEIKQKKSYISYIAKQQTSKQK
jgi:hypothetical protein